MKKAIGLTDTSHSTLARAARDVVAGAIAGEFPPDPIIGPELSRAISCVLSTTKRHGGALERTIAAALEASERFIVMTNVPLPITKGARQLLDAKNSDASLSQIKLSADSEVEKMVNVDLVVVDPEEGWCGAYEVKRGNGATEYKRRREIIWKMKAARLVLASFVSQSGYGPISRTTSAVIDYFGSSGFDSEWALRREQIDLHFGVPVTPTVDAMTQALKDALDAELPRLFGPVFDLMTLPDQVAVEQQTRTPPARRPVPREGAIFADLSAPPSGPGARSKTPTKH